MDVRLRDLHAFDDTKAGVKGLVDAGVTTVPAIFHHPPDPLPLADDVDAAIPVVPVIDLSLADDDRDKLVALVKAAAETVGFFQVVNHGVSGEVLDEMLAAVRRFNEQPAEAKRPYFTRDFSRKVMFNSNFDLFQTPAASWRDTLLMEMAPEGPAPEELPEACRAAVVQYAAAVRRLGEPLFELLSEALGLPSAHLGRDVGCLDGLSILAHYYPSCPEPHKTMGTNRHSDPSFLTVLLQDSAMGGLQVLLQSRWVDIPPVAGALVVNIGDLLQLVSNDRLRSVEHRVVLTSASSSSSRLSVACFFRPHNASTRAYDPITNDARPPAYRITTASEYLAHFNGKGLDGRSALDHFRLPPPSPVQQIDSVSK
ncbi:hypothetical protein ABZP36_035369 [Zizania latifolia]